MRSCVVDESNFSDVFFSNKILRQRWGATTIRITSLSIMTLSMTDLFVTHTQHDGLNADTQY
jgi:hypothetical protein